jgi:hypothetical protein
LVFGVTIVLTSLDRLVRVEDHYVRTHITSLFASIQELDTYLGVDDMLILIELVVILSHVQFRGV